MLAGTRAHIAFATGHHAGDTSHPNHQQQSKRARSSKGLKFGRSLTRSRKPRLGPTGRQEAADQREDGESSFAMGGTVEPLELELLRVEMSQIKSIDQQRQTFGVRVFLQFVVRGGARADSMLQPSGFRSAEWFMSTFRWHNAAHQPNELDSRVIKMGEDLHMILEVEADFFEQMELESFPWDHQECTVVMKVASLPSCR